MIFTIKNTIRGQPDEFKDILFKNTEASKFYGQDCSTK